MSDDKPASDNASKKPEENDEEAAVKDDPDLDSEGKPYNEKSPVHMARRAIKNKYATMCCCCVLVCEDEKTKDARCCCCLPIKCGVQVIAASIIIITVVQFLEIFYQLLNDHIDWWYVLVGVAISIPLIIAFGMTIYFFAEDSDGTRVGLQSGAILLIISVALLATWNACYFTLLYNAEQVVTGNDGVGFVTVTVKQQVVFSLWIAAVVCAFFAYYICVLSEYKNLYREHAIDKWIGERKEEEAAAAAKKKAKEDKKKAAEGGDKPEGEEDKKEGD